MDEGESVEQAAVREAEEEIALRPDSVEVAGRGPTFFIPPSGFWVVPVVARWREPHELQPNPWEVDEVLHVPLTTLLEEERWRYVPLSDRGAGQPEGLRTGGGSGGPAMWAWDLGDDLLWGATAMMIAALLGVVDEGWSGGMGPEELGEDRRVLPWEDFPLPALRQRLSGVPEVPFGEVPVASSGQVREIDRLLSEDGRVEVTQLLEQAGRGVTDAVRRLVEGDLTGATVTVLLGPGGTGDAGAATARLLTSAGADVRALLVGEPRDRDRVSALRSFGVDVGPLDEDAQAGDVVVDAILGLGARPPVHGPVEAAIGWLRRFDVPVVAVDLPSGVHPDRGLEGPCVTAAVTVALGAPKPAHTHRIVRPYLGDLYLADLGIPAAAWEAVGLTPVSAFGRAPLVRLVDVPAEGPTDRADA